MDIIRLIASDAVCTGDRRAMSEERRRDLERDLETTPLRTFIALRVQTEADLSVIVSKAPNARIAIKELADGDGTLGWTCAIPSWDREERSVRDCVAIAAHRLEHEVAVDAQKGLPQVAAQIDRLKALADGGFTLVVEDKYGREPRVLDQDLSFFRRGDAVLRVPRTLSSAGDRPAGLSSLDLDGVARYAKSCRRIVVLTGAGISTNCGIPDYRSAGGMWETLQAAGLTATPEQRQRIQESHEYVAHIDLFRENPTPFLEVKRDFISGCAEGRWKPAAFHSFTRVLHEEGVLAKLVTQNIDGLHTAAGLPQDSIMEAHGSMARAECWMCGAAMSMADYAAAVRAITRDLSGKDRSAPATSTPGGVRCERRCCEGTVKPAVVLFGEALPGNFDEVVDEATADCDLLIIAGTSLTVGPVNTIPSRVPRSCVRVLINGCEAGRDVGLVFDERAQRDVFLEGDIDEMTCRLAAAMGLSSRLADIASGMNDKSAATARAFAE